MLYWTATEAGRRAGVTRLTVERLEQHSGIPPSRSQTLVDLQRAFETAGIEFIGTPEEGPGVRLWKTSGGARQKSYRPPIPKSREMRQSGDRQLHAASGRPAANLW